MATSQSPTAAPLANTHVLLLVSPGRVPLATAGPTEDPDITRLSLEVLGQGYGVNLHLRGPLPVLRAVVTDLSDALDQQGGGGPPLLTRPHDWPEGGEGR